MGDPQSVQLGYNPISHVRSQRTIAPVDNCEGSVLLNLELNENANPYSASLVEAEGFMGRTSVIALIVNTTQPT